MSIFEICIEPIKQSYDLGEPIQIKWTLYNNTEHELYLLERALPIDACSGANFYVYWNGTLCVYRGKRYHTPPITVEDYKRIGAKAKKTRIIEISQDYDMSRDGNYRIQSIGTILDYKTFKPVEISQFEPISFKSNYIMIHITKNGDPSAVIASPITQILSKHPKSSVMIIQQNYGYFPNYTFLEFTRTESNNFYSLLINVRESIQMALNLYAEQDPGVISDMIIYFGTDQYYWDLWVSTLQKILAISAFVFVNDLSMNLNANAWCFANTNCIYLVYVNFIGLSDNDKKLTFLHEMCHLVGNAVDVPNANTQTTCQMLANTNPLGALSNAYNYQYFFSSLIYNNRI